MVSVERWPVLRYDEWTDTLQTLHLWSQVVGKIRLALTPMVNHWWNVTLLVSSRGLTTGAMPYERGRTFSMEFDFIDHMLRIDGCDGETAGFALEPMTVADFYKRTMNALAHLDIHVKIRTMPCEIPDAIPFDRDAVHASYDKAYVDRFWRVLLQADRLCKVFRSPFLGKASPVHFFWGSFDLAVSRFSGRPAPPHPGGIPNLADWVTREAYSHEEHSVGFWPGGFGLEALFYAYVYPEPAGFSAAPIQPTQASWNAQLKEFVLPYEAVRTNGDPDRSVLDFFDSTYDAGATLARWDRAALERAAH